MSLARVPTGKKGAASGIGGASLTFFCKQQHQQHQLYFEGKKNAA
jgi:hypothetical protein